MSFTFRPLNEEEKKQIIFHEPPEGFDARKADDTILLKHGYPLRPDAKTQPDMHAAWERLFSRPLKHVRAELSVRQSPAPPSTAQPAAAPAYDPPPLYFGSWAGAAVVLSSSYGVHPADPAMESGITFQIPQLNTGIAGVPPQQEISLQAGIDGVNGELVTANAGIYCGLQPLAGYSDGRKYAAWAQLQPVYYMSVDNFTANWPDQVVLIVSRPDPLTVTYLFSNLATNTIINFSYKAQNGQGLYGNNASWAVAKKSTILPVFPELVFQNCYVRLNSGKFLYAANGQVGEITKTGTSGSAPLTGTTATDRTVVCKWLAGE